MKNFLVAAALLAATTAHGQGLTPESVYLYMGAYSKYVLGNNLVAAKGSVAQGGVTFTWQNGVYLDLWGSAPFRKKPENDFGNETDVTLGWKGNLGGMKVNAAIAHYNLFPVGTLDNNDIHSIFAEVSPGSAWRAGGTSVLPFLKVEVLNSSGRAVDNATQVFAGVYTTTPLNGGVLFNQKIRIGHQPSFPGLASGWNGYYKAALEKTYKNKLTLGIQYERFQSFGLDGGRTDHNVVGVTAGIPF